MRAIETRDLTKSFGAVQAVRGLTMEVAEGELVAFLGPNGAGKSTSLRLLTTLLAPTGGTATVAGRDIRTDPAGVRRRIGYDRAGPAEPGQPVGPRAAAAPGARHDDLPHHPLPGRGRHDGRAGAGHGRRQGRR